MATWDDVRKIALALPEVSERPSRGRPFWRVREKGFVWDRPLRATDLEALGEAAPKGEILGVRVEHLGAKEASRSLPTVRPGEQRRAQILLGHMRGVPAELGRHDMLSVSL